MCEAMAITLDRVQQRRRALMPHSSGVAAATARLAFQAAQALLLIAHLILSSIPLAFGLAAVLICRFQRHLQAMLRFS